MQEFYSCKESLYMGLRGRNIADCIADGMLENPAHLAAFLGLPVEDATGDRDHYGMNSLLWAAYGGGNVDVVRALLETRVFNCDDCCHDGQNALIYAVQGGNVRLTQMLLEYHQFDDLREALLYAAMSDQHEMFLALWKHVGEDADMLPIEQSDDGRNLLHYAGCAETAKLLVRLGVDPAAADDYGNTPLHWVSDPGVIKVLVSDRRVDVNKTDCYGRTPLHSASDRFEDNPSTVLALLQGGATDHLRTPRGDAAIHIAARGGNVMVIEQLLLIYEPESWRYVVDIPNDEGSDTALHIAARSGDARAVQTLMSLGASIRRCNARRKTPLCVAANDDLRAMMLAAE